MIEISQITRNSKKLFDILMPQIAANPERGPELIRFYLGRAYARGYLDMLSECKTKEPRP